MGLIVDHDHDDTTHRLQENVMIGAEQSIHTVQTVHTVLYYAETRRLVYR